MAKISILIADASRLFAEALAKALWWTPDFEVMNEYPPTSAAAVAAAAKLKPDIALMDYWMPDKADIDVVTGVLEASSKTNVLVLSWLTGRREIENSLASGAVGFLPKSLSIGQVVRAIYEAHEGKSPVFAEELRKLLENLQVREQSHADLRQRLANLTPREVRLLEELSKGLSNKEIAKELSISPATVKRHFYNITLKIHAATKEEALAMARSLGLVR